jgi:exonuclease V gamma subunit
MSMNDPNQPQQINIELGEKEAEGIYSNLAIITHSPAEFVIDFTRVLPGIPKAKVHARIVMTPQHMRMLLSAIKSNIENYEKKFGEIKLVGDAAGSPLFGFQPPGKEEKVN